MKKSKLVVAAAALISGSVLMSSCIGSFALTNKVLDWNKSLGNKAVNEIVFICFHIIPVYEVTIFCDGIVLNTIEFWSGSNPMADNVKTIKGNDATYTVASHKTGYTITNQDTKESIELVYNTKENSWAVEANGQSTTFMTFVDDNHVKMYGSDAVIELSQAGAMAYQSIVNGSMAVACK